MERGKRVSFADRRRFLRGLVGTAGALVAPPAIAEVERSPLRELAAAKGLLYGSTAAATQLAAGDDFTALLAQECAMIVPENEMKWSEMSHRRDESDFSRGDAMVAFAGHNHLRFRGHALLWYWRTPAWFYELPSREAAAAALQRRVETMMTRYRDRIFCWDVVNEPLNPPDGRPDGLRNAAFLETVGPEYLDAAFAAARAADPACKLAVNEYGIEYDTPEDEAKRTALLRLLERMRRTGTPVDVVGIQGHLWTNEKPFSGEKLRRFLGEIAALGLQIQLTELDVTDVAAPADPVRRDQMVADAYERFLDAALDETAVKAVITWGLSDRHSWIVRRENGTDGWRHDGVEPRPLPFDKELRPKPAWTAIARALAGAPTREPG